VTELVNQLEIQMTILNKTSSERKEFEKYIHAEVDNIGKIAYDYFNKY